MIEVTLTEEDERLADDAAQKRNQSQRQAGRKDGKVVEDSIGIDRQGARAELAISKAFDIPWDGKFFDIERWFNWRNEGHDVSGLEVRSTHHPRGALILHPKDKDYSPFLLVLTHKRPTYVIAGWCYGYEGKQQKWWRDVGYGRPCFYAPQQYLRDIEELKEKISTQRSNNESDSI